MKAPATWAMPASASIRPSHSASKTRTCCSCLARASAKCRRRAIRCSIFRRPKQQLIHVHASADELGRVYQPDLPINAGPRAFAAALAKTAPVDGSAWRGWRDDARKAYEAWQVAPRTPGALQMGEVIAHFAPRPAPGCDHRQRRRQLRHLGPSLLPLPAVRDPACANIRVDGLWRRPRPSPRSSSTLSARSSLSLATAAF